MPGKMETVGRRGLQPHDSPEIKKAQSKIAYIIKSSKGRCDPMDEAGLFAKIRARMMEHGEDLHMADRQIRALSFFGAGPYQEATSEAESEGHVVSDASTDQDASASLIQREVSGQILWEHRGKVSPTATQPHSPQPHSP